MEKPNSTNQFSLSNWLKQFARRDLLLLLLDIIAVNAAYFLALIVRFYVNNEFRSSVSFYLDYFVCFAPVYTVLCIVIFALFRLYGGMWRYAGINDMNRILLANLCTVAVQVAGSMISIALLPHGERTVSRMPVSYYAIGAVLQLVFMLLSRFAHRMLLVEKTKIAGRRMEKVPALVIGCGELGRKVVHHLEENSPYRTVAIVGKDSGRMMDGVPVVPLESMKQLISDKAVKAVFVADKTLSKEERETVRKAAEQLELEDYTGYLSNQAGFLPLTSLLEAVEMPIRVEVNGQEREFASAEECLAALPGEYDVLRVKATKLVLKKREQDNSWMKVYQEQTGQEVSFF